MGADGVSQLAALEGNCMRCAISLLLVPITVLSSACSLFSPYSQMINIVPSNATADVYVDGQRVGSGNQSVRMSKSHTHSVMVKCGISAGTGTVRRTMSTTGVLDIVGGALILIPLVGLFAPGAHSLEPTTLSVAIPDESSCQQTVATGGGGQPAAPTPPAH
jgi:hypothetical protein